MQTTKMKYLIVITLLFLLSSCTEYTPKPRGYVRIEPQKAQYTSLPLTGLPYSFNVSNQTTIELAPEEDNVGWINIAYPSLGAKIYCSFFLVTPSTLSEAEDESRSFVLRQAKRADMITEKEYTNRDERVYGTLFILDGESAAPIQFILTDSISRFFRGSLYYEMKTNADSLAPVTSYLLEDVRELMQSFSWKD